MNMLTRCLFACLLLFGTLSVSASFVANNSNAGNGFVTGAFPSFTITGSENGASNNYTFYTDTFASAGSITFSWNYVTNDCCGSYWDPAGYVLNGLTTQLTTDISGSMGDGNAFGTTTVGFNAGDTFGWYVFSRDSCCGAGNLTIRTLSNDQGGQIPEPASVALVGLALAGLTGQRLYRRRQRA